MSHHHEPISREREISRITLVGSLVNFLLLIFKFAAGFFGKSSAMLADAVHSLSDFATDVVVIVFVKLSAKPEDAEHKYGHGKYETLATLIIALVLLVAGAGIIKSGIELIIKYFRGEVLPRPGMLALIAAAVSILFKELMYRYTVYKGKHLNSQVVVANAWHHRSDALSSIGTAIGIGGAILLGEKWRILDPLAAVIVGVFIIRVSLKLLKQGLQELLEHSLPAEIEAQIIDTILTFPEVSEPHHLRTRRVGIYNAMDVHIRLRGDMTLHDAHEVTRRIELALRERFGKNFFINIHMEPEVSNN